MGKTSLSVFVINFAASLRASCLRPVSVLLCMIIPVSACQIAPFRHSQARHVPGCAVLRTSPFLRFFPSRNLRTAVKLGDLGPMPDPLQETLSSRSYLSSHSHGLEGRQRGRPRLATPAEGASAVQVGIQDWLLYGLAAENASRIVVRRSVVPSVPIVSRKKPPWRTCAVESQPLNAHWAQCQDSWITYTTL